MNWHKTVIFTLLLLYLLYLCQDILYLQGPLISQLALFLILIICLFYLIKFLLIKTSTGVFSKVWTAFFFINIAGFVLTSSFVDQYKFGMFKAVLLTLSSFYPFFYVSYRGIDIRRYFLIFFYVMVPFAIGQFYFNQASILSERVSENVNVVNNFSYLFVCLVPFLFFLRVKFVGYILLSILAFYIIEGAKRGALIAGGLGILAYFIYLLKEQSFKTKISKIRTFIFLFVGVILVGYFAYLRFLDNEFLQERLELMIEGNSSNRTEDFGWILDAWLSADRFVYLLFGFGFGASLEITGRHFAHNDWLEALSNFGLLGFLLYFFLFLTVFRFVRKNIYKLDERMQLYSIIFIWFFMTLVSMFYTSLNSFVMVMVLAYLMGRNQYKISA